MGWMNFLYHIWCFLYTSYTVTEFMGDPAKKGGERSVNVTV